ncbi:MAG: S8 family peptidase [Actinomycetota bacterium]
MGARKGIEQRNTDLKWLYGRGDLAVSSCRSGGEFWYRPGQVLVATDDLDDDLQAQLRRWGAKPERGGTFAEIGATRFRVPDDVDVPSLVADLRTRPDGRVVRIGPHSVFIGEPPYHGGPGSNVTPAGAVRHARRYEPKRACTVGILDTGVRSRHEWLARYDVAGIGVDFDEDQQARLDHDTNSALDRQAGHGTFIAGVVLQQAPAANVRVASVLDSEGVGDEETVIAGLLQLGDADIINLSLGGYTLDNAAPVGIAGLLASLLQRRPDRVVIAAAGNNNASRPFWPAAFKRVVAVAALTEDGSARAPFSNYGWWLDACAPGENVHSTFVRWDGIVTTTGTPATFDDFAAWGGTSFAAPKVAGTIAAHVTRAGLSPSQAAHKVVYSGVGGYLPDLGVKVKLARP